MTVTELQTKHDELVQSLGMIRLQSGDKSVEYGRQIEAIQQVERLIAKASGGSGVSCTFGTFSKG